LSQHLQRFFYFVFLVVLGEVALDDLANQPFLLILQLKGLELLETELLEHDLRRGDGGGFFLGYFEFHIY
jgi:hypothetical protein